MTDWDNSNVRIFRLENPDVLSVHRAVVNSLLQQLRWGIIREKWYGSEQLVSISVVITDFLGGISIL